MKIITHNIKSNDDIRIIPFADLHIGSAKCNLTLIKEQVEKVRKDKNTYAIIVGDLINNSTKNSVGDVFSEKLSPMEQMEVACDIFEPIKDKIIAITAGNHERRSYKYDGVDLTAFFAMKLGLEKVYDYVAPMVFISVGFDAHKRCSNVYAMYITHGDGANGRLVGGKANSLERRGNIIDADIIVVGHTHTPMTFKESHISVNRNAKTCMEVETTFVNCGATLDYEGYAELYGMRPSSTAQPEIILGGKKKDVKVLV